MSRPRFLYHAYALGVSGRVNDDLVEPQVASALPLAGGQSAANWTNYQLQSLFQYDAAQTKTTGSFNESEDTHKTVSSVKVEGFNLDNTVLAKEISVQLTSVHSASKDDQPTFSLTGTQFDELVVAGEKIELESLVSRYSELSTYKAVQDYYSNDPKTLDGEMLRTPEATLPEKIRSYFPWCGKNPKPGLPSHRDVTIVPLFLVKNKSVPGRFEVINNVIRVVGFGVVQLGQLVLTPYERRVTMIQVDLDPACDDSSDNAVQSFGIGGSSRASGGVSCGSVGSNGGQTDPPIGN